MRAAQQIELAERSTDAPAAEAAYAARCRAFFARELASPSPWIFGWLATDARGVTVGASLLTLAPGMPRFGAESDGADGRIRNLYVIPAARGRGLGRALTVVAIEAATARGVARLVLGASPMGRPVYLALGFVAKDDEMIYDP